MRIIAIATALMMTGSAWAATVDGFMTAGGVGGIQCSVYSNALAEARQHGLRTIQGVNTVNAFTQYAFGFFTGYNSVSDGIFDILAGIRGNEMDISILSMAGQYCTENPLENYDAALIHVLKEIFPRAATQKP